MNWDELLWRRWGKIIKRLDHVAQDQRPGYTIVQMQILIGPDGEPKFWTKPIVTQIEPLKADVTEVLMAMAGIPQLVLTQVEEDDNESD